VATVIAAIETGINWIDTAPIYGCGDSEKAVGKALKELGERPIIATKCGLVWNKKREKINCLKPESIKAECEESLKRLGVDVIDLYQMHWPMPDEQVERAWEAMAELVEEGKVRFIGASNFSIGQLERIRRIYPVASLQPPYSMLRRGFEDELLGYCKKYNIGVVCYSPMQKGLLTGKVTAEWVANLAPDDHRRRDPSFAEPRLSTNLELVERVKLVADRHGRSIAELAIAWVLRSKEVTSAIVGARRPEQIKQTAGAGDWQLEDEDIAEIEKLLSI
jgi:aryl-alcohol dehydrogenase-like predicted oxidoreductase